MLPFAHGGACTHAHTRIIWHSQTGQHSKHTQQSVIRCGLTHWRRWPRVLFNAFPSLHIFLFYQRGFSHASPTCLAQLCLFTLSMPGLASCNCSDTLNTVLCAVTTAYSMTYAVSHVTAFLQASYKHMYKQLQVITTQLQVLQANYKKTTSNLQVVYKQQIHVVLD